jgi:hypothetical protein
MALETVLIFTVLILAICLAAVGLTLNEKIEQLIKRHDLEMSAVSKEVTRLIRQLNSTREELATLEDDFAERSESSQSLELEVEEDTRTERSAPSKIAWPTIQTPPVLSNNKSLNQNKEKKVEPRAFKPRATEDPTLEAERRKREAEEERLRSAKKAKRLKAALAQRELGVSPYFLFFLKRAYKLRTDEAEALCEKLEVFGQSRSEPHFKLEYLKNEIYRRWTGKDEQVDQLRLWLDKTIIRADQFASSRAGFTGRHVSPQIEALEDRQQNRYGD